MELRLTYKEINDLIEKKSGHVLPMQYGGPHTVRITYEVTVMFKKSSIGIDITIDQIDGRDIYLSYDGGSGIDYMVRQAINMARKKPGGEIIEPLDGSRIRLDFSRAPQANTLMDHIELRDIRFDEQYVIIIFSPK